LKIGANIHFNRAAGLLLVNRQGQILARMWSEGDGHDKVDNNWLSLFFLTTEEAFCAKRGKVGMGPVLARG